MHKHPVTIAVLGGQGALASATFVHRLVRAWPRHHRCEHDFDYPRLLHLSEGLPGLGPAGVEDSSEAFEALRGRISTVVGQGADVIVIPCNSLHPIALELQELTRVWILTPLGASRSTRAGQALTVLASTSTTELLECSRPKSWSLPAPGLSPLVPAAIKAVLQGDLEYGQRNLETLVQSLISRGSTPLLACTELSCLQPLPGVLDAMDDLVTQTLHLCKVPDSIPTPR